MPKEDNQKIEKTDQEIKDEMIESMLTDLGVGCMEYSPATAQNCPYWLLEVCDTLIRKGWRK